MTSTRAGRRPVPLPDGHGPPATSITLSSLCPGRSFRWASRSMAIIGSLARPQRLLRSPASLRRTSPIQAPSTSPPTTPWISQGPMEAAWNGIRPTVLPGFSSTATTCANGFFHRRAHLPRALYAGQRPQPAGVLLLGSRDGRPCHLGSSAFPQVKARSTCSFLLLRFANLEVFPHHY